MQEYKLPEKISKQIQRDFEPVQPLGPAHRRASLLLILWLVLVGIVLAVFGMRKDYNVLGPWTVWLLPLAQLFVGYIIVTLAIRSTIPDAATPTSLLILAVLLGISVHLAISEITFHLSPTWVEAGRLLPLAGICFVITLCLGLIPLFLMLFLCSKGFGSRPGFIGLISGFGCGLSAEAAWRMHCHYSAWNHVIFAHTGAVLFVTLLGWLIGYRYLRRSK